jgi:hypothetical protein
MSNSRFFFEPEDLDFHLRALALCDYQREVLGRQPRIGNTLKSESLKEQHFMWLLGEIINAAYLPFAGSLIEFVDGKYVWVAGQKLPNNYQECLRFANQIFHDVSDDEEANKALQSLEVVTRKNFFSSISHIAESVLKSAVLRTKFDLLQESFIHGDSLWKLIRRDQTGYTPWVIPELCTSNDLDIKVHRLRILRLINEVLQGDLSQFENPARKSEFGTPEISLIRLANFVRRLDHSERSTNKGSDSKHEVFPAEVGTILSHLQKKLGISNRRHFLVALSVALSSNLDLVEPEQIDTFYFGIRSS